MKDKEFLYWLADRLVYRYNIPINTDYIIKLRSIAIRTNAEQDTVMYVPSPTVKS